MVQEPEPAVALGPLRSVRMKIEADARPRVAMTCQKPALIHELARVPQHLQIWGLPPEPDVSSELFLVQY
jgi:hypothetical protein